MKFKFNWDDNLSLNKTIESRSMIIVATVVFHENNKNHPQVFVDECLCKYKIMKKMNIVKMLHYDRVDVYEGVDVNKIRESRE